MTPLRLWPRPRSQASAPFGFAVVGLGHGAHKFLEAVRSSSTVGITALVSADRSKANRMARRYGVPDVYTYAEFDRLTDNPRVQAVYLSLPNALHLPFAQRAAAAGKHVLCEKPLAGNVPDAEAMIEACRRAERLLMVGYRTSFTSVHQRARQMIASGILGPVQCVRSGFGFRAKPGWRLDPALAGGGSLFDVGIYSVHAFRTLFGEAPTITAATVKRDPGTGLELETHWHGQLSSGATVDCRSSYLEKIRDHLTVEAERGTLTLEPAFAYDGLRLRVRARNPDARRELDLDLRTPRNEPSAFRLEAEHLAHCATTGAPLRTPGEEGLQELEVLEQIYRCSNSPI